VAGSNFLCPYPDPKLGIKTFAKREGDYYVINGSKAAFCTNAGVADAYYVMARTDLTKPPFMSTAVFWVPADTPGLSFGKKTEMIGGGAMQQAEVFLDDVRVPVGNRIGGDGDLSNLFVMKTMPYLGTGLAAIYVGLSRAAYEYALDYAKERISWGVPIIQHQAVSLKLADMYVDVQTARLMTWDAAYAVDSGDHLAHVKALAAKTHAVDVAIKVAENAVKILGGYGVTKEYKTAGYLCKAWMGWSCDGTRDMLRLAMMNFMEPPPGFGAPGDPPPGMEDPLISKVKESL
jgi:alkylation response protein AidB-like acyl-CoA dehydrogenase